MVGKECRSKVRTLLSFLCPPKAVSYGGWLRVRQCCAPKVRPNLREGPASGRWQPCPTLRLPMAPTPPRGLCFTPPSHPWSSCVLLGLALLPGGLPSHHGLSPNSTPRQPTFIHWGPSRLPLCPSITGTLVCHLLNTFFKPFFLSHIILKEHWEPALHTQCPFAMKRKPERSSMQ